MTKRTQNRVAESRFTLPTVMAYAVIVWLGSGLLIFPDSLNGLQHGAWVQFMCFLVSVFLMACLNTNHALLRVYSQTIACSFAVLLCAGNFLFTSLGGAVVQVCVIATYLTVFRTYQDKTAVGWSYYTFLCVGLASCYFVQILFFVPLLWSIMFFQLSSLSQRTFLASLLGLLTPYWFAFPLLLFRNDVAALRTHFAAIADFQEFSTGILSLTTNEWVFYILVVLLGITGTVHYQRKKSADNIRIRLFYDCFILLWIVAAVFLILQPQHYDMLIRLIIVNVSPLIAHFLTLTNTRVTNIAFYVICVAVLLMAIYNLWMPSLLF